MERNAMARKFRSRFKSADGVLENAVITIVRDMTMRSGESPGAENPAAINGAIEASPRASTAESHREHQKTVILTLRSTSIA
jgi:hypothetical protein